MNIFKQDDIEAVIEKNAALGVQMRWSAQK